MVVGALSCCALFHYVSMKAEQMNVLSSLIRELMLYEFEPGRKVAEATKNIEKEREREREKERERGGAEWVFLFILHNDKTVTIVF